MAVGWQQLVSKGRLWGWHCGCAGLVAGGAWFAWSCCAGTRRVCTGLALKIVQKTGWAAAGAGEEIAQESRSTGMSDQSQRSGWTGAVHRGSAPVVGGAMTWAGGKYRGPSNLHHPQ